LGRSGSRGCSSSGACWGVGSGRSHANGAAPSGSQAGGVGGCSCSTRRSSTGGGSFVAGSTGGSSGSGIVVPPPGAGVATGVVGIELAAGGGVDVRFR
jgi:hypothetical protein